MGETLPMLMPTFNRSLIIEARPERLSSDGGAVLLRELLERSGIIPWMTARLADPREQDQVTYDLGELLRTALVLFGQGWRDQDDADALRFDPALRLAIAEARGTAALSDDYHLPSQPTLSRLLATLSQPANLAVLRQAIAELAGRRLRAMRRGHRRREVTLDIDGLPIEVHGKQPGSAWNGHYHQRMYHPLVASVAETGDLLDARLRAGNVHTADGALDFILDLVGRVETTLCQVALVRIDAGFPDETLLAGLEANGTPYVARIKNNKVLDRMAAEHLRRPPGRPPAEPRVWFHEMTYAAGAWSRERRVVLVVLEQPDDLLLKHFWLLTSINAKSLDGEALLALYRQRGTAEGHMGELMDVLAPALSSTERARWPDTTNAFAHNEALLLLHLLAYEVMHTGRCVMEKLTRTGWSLRRFRERVLKVGVRIVLHARRATLVIAETAAAHWQSLWRALDTLAWNTA
jgi:Transposase DDE domain group 1